MNRDNSSNQNQVQNQSQSDLRSKLRASNLAEATKMKSNALMISLLTLVLGLIGGTLIGMYLLSPQPSLMADKNKQIINLEKELAALKSNKPIANGVDLTDQDKLILETLKKTEGFDYTAVAVIKIEGDWALSSPIPINFDQNSGYSIPAMGMTEYVWHKVNNGWQYVAQAQESGYDPDEVKDVPLSVIPESSRGGDLL